MNLADFLREIQCRHCPWRRVWGPDEMIEQLRYLGSMRRNAKPDPDFLIQLFEGKLREITCPDCGSLGLVSREFKHEDDWGDARSCEICRQSIPAERLEIFPDITRCAGCQEKPAARSEDDFCPKCGGLTRVQSSSGGGVSRYRTRCTDCGYVC